MNEQPHARRPVRGAQPRRRRAALHEPADAEPEATGLRRRFGLDLLLPVPPHPVRRDPARRDHRQRSELGARAQPAPIPPGTGDAARSPRPRSPRPSSRSTRTSCAGFARSDSRPTRVTVRQEPGATLPAVPKNLVIVESPAKARTIERYLGDDYRVLASYGHVRDLPENPGKGKFGVDVDHDFAPEYVISADRRKQVADIEKAAKGADAIFLATDLDREGEAIAWHVAEATHMVAGKTRRVTFNEITESAIREAFAQPPPDRPAPGRCPAGAPDRRPPGRLHPEPAAVAQGARWPLRRTRPVGGRPAGGRTRARDRGVQRARVLDDRGDPGDARRRAVRGRGRADRRGGARRAGRGDGRPSRGGDPGPPPGRHQGRNP